MSPSPSLYADLEIRIMAKQAEGYPVEITLDRERQLGRGFLDPALTPWIGTSDPAADGERLFRGILHEAGLTLAWGTARGYSRQRRIRLRLDADAPELHAIPWELLRDPTGATPLNLAAHPDTPFSRYFAGEWRPGRAVLSRPVRLLAVIANPQDLGVYNLAPVAEAEEWASLCDVLAGQEVELVRYPPVDATGEPGPCTLAGVEAELSKGYHGLHFIGHGVRPDDRSSAVLFMADAQNRAVRVSEEQLAEMLGRVLRGGDEAAERLRLVFLASCSTATRSPAAAFRGIAPRLVHAGVPAVVAMQDQVPVETARRFAAAFYQRLLAHGQADLACNEARAALLPSGTGGRGDLATASIPVLFMRLPQGQLLGQRGEILGKSSSSFWTALTGKIASGECIPILGPGVSAELLPSPVDMARALAIKYDYPFPATQSLPRVAQFVASIDDATLRVEVLKLLVEGYQARLGRPAAGSLISLGAGGPLSATIRASGWPAQRGEQAENDVYRQLAEFGLPLYITTDFDNLMAVALSARLGKPVRQVSIAWPQAVSLGPERPHFELQPAAAAGDPVVLHLFGTDADPDAMVLTEDDYLDYLARLARDRDFVLPTDVNLSLTRHTLLFLGYRLDDLDLKVLLRGLLPNPSLNMNMRRGRVLRVAVQVETEAVDQEKQAEVPLYFQRYFQSSEIDVYWGSTQHFVAELYDRWREAYHHD